MDKVDVDICRLLFQNSRASYREIGDAVALSPTAVHRRINDLLESGIIESFDVDVDIRFLKGLSIMIFGRSDYDPAAIKRQVEGDDHTSMLLLAGGGMIYLGAFLRSPVEMEGYAEKVREAAHLTDMTLGIHNLKPGGTRIVEVDGEREMSPLEMRIVRALRGNARRGMAELAEVIGVSTKTVRRKLKSLEEDGVVNYTIRWSPDRSGGAVVMLHLHVEGDRMRTISAIQDRLHDSVVFFNSFSNIPGSVIAVGWVQTLKEVEVIMGHLRDMGIERVIPNIIYTGHHFSTWKDRL